MREVVVTGIGLISCAGEGIDAHLAALAAGAPPPTDAETFAPFPVHPVAAPNYDNQIPKKSDQRQMEPWQRLGTYAAGLALDAAGAKEDAALKSRMHLVVAAGGGERDYAADGQILTGLRSAGSWDMASSATCDNFVVSAGSTRTPAALPRAITSRRSPSDSAATPSPTST